MTNTEKKTAMKPATYSATLRSSRQVTADSDTGEELRELIFEIDDPSFPCEVGQSIGVTVPQTDENEPATYRLYSIAEFTPPKGKDGKPSITVIVHRSIEQDPITGEEKRGITSNYLCDLQPEATLNISGPHGHPFPIPENKSATMILIGVGTGIAPFRAFVKHIYHNVPDWKGLIRLFYGTLTGIDILYANDPHGDVMQYFDKETFEAFEALSPAPNWADPISWDLAYSERGEELLGYLRKDDTYVYVTGLKSIRERLDTLFSTLLGAPERWEAIKDDLIASGRWIELLY